MRWYSALLSALLAMLGFESCSNIGGEPLVEYGVPSVKFQVKGSLTDEAGRPVEGIKVTVAEGGGGEYFEQASTVTDAQGQYAVQEVQATAIDYGQFLLVEDTDGPDGGGEFRSDTISLKGLPRKQVQKGDGHWYDGKYEVRGDIKLKRK